MCRDGPFSNPQALGALRLVLEFAHRGARHYGHFGSHLVPM